MNWDENEDNGGLSEEGRSSRNPWRRLPMLVRASLISIGIGLFGILIGGDRICFRLLFFLGFYIGMTLLMIWLVKLFILPIVRRRQIVEQWSLLIANGQSRSDQMVEHVRKLIQDTRAPDVTLEEDGSLTTSMLYARIAVAES